MIRVEQQITELVYSNIPGIVDEYVPATVYTVGDYARVGNYVYASASDPNEGNYPPDTLGTSWTLWGPSNAHALIDLYENTVTEWTGTGIVTFARGSKDSLGVGNYVADTVTVDYLDALDVVLDSDVFTTSPNQYVWDYWGFMYAPFTFDQRGVFYTPLKRIGVNIRVTFAKGGNATSCGYMVAGIAVECGGTLDGVKFPDRRIGSRTQTVATFTTTLEQQLLNQTSTFAKAKVNIPQMFIIDPSVDSVFQNMIIIGKISKCDSTARSGFINNYIDWEIEQNVEA